MYRLRHSGHVVEKILRNLIHLHMVVISHSDTIFGTLPVTIPPLPNAFDLDDSIRREVNDGIILFSTHCLSYPYISLESIWLGRENVSYWSSDMVHFSPKGYDGIGEIIYKTMSTDYDMARSKAAKNMLRSKLKVCGAIEFSNIITLNVLKHMRQSNITQTKAFDCFENT